ncbi:hypothetical protein OHJ21_07680 [Virgibacillus sp. LDC1]|nr:hypothetical protein [Virgibacillus sp. LDC1]
MMKVVIIVIVFGLIFAACSSSDRTSKIITDSITKPTINTVTKNELDSGQVIYNHNYDNMDRGNHDLKGQVVVDLKYYNDHAMVAVISYILQILKLKRILVSTVFLD